MLVLNINACRLHPCKPNFHSPCMNVALVSGRTATQNRKSVTARFTTNTFGVVLSDFSFQTAINTNAFPQAPSTIREHVTRISMVTWREPRGWRSNGAFVDSFILRHPGRCAETNLLSKCVTGIYWQRNKPPQLSLFWEVPGQLSFHQLHTYLTAYFTFKTCWELFFWWKIVIREGSFLFGRRVDVRRIALVVNVRISWGQMEQLVAI